MRAPAVGGDLLATVRVRSCCREWIPPRLLSLHDVDEMVLSDPS